MKYPLIVWFAIYSLLSASDIVWQKDLAQALQQARQEHKLVMVMVEGKHCRWCKKMRYRTLSNESVTQKLSSYINVRVDEQDKKAMSMLPSIRGVPTIFFLYPDKKVIESVEGYYNVEDFLSFFKEIEQKVWALEKASKGKH